MSPPRIKRIWYWLRDRVYPAPEGNPQKTEALPPQSLAGEALEFAYDWLKDEVKAEDERSKIVDGKLQNILPLSSIVITLVLALITFLTSGRASQFTRSSVLVVTVGGAYVALQFLCAFSWAIRGLSRKSYERATLTDITPQTNDPKTILTWRAIQKIFSQLQHNKEVTNHKVTQLACGHTAIKNGVWGLVLVIIIVCSIVAFRLLCEDHH